MPVQVAITKIDDDTNIPQNSTPRTPYDLVIAPNTTSWYIEGTATTDNTYLSEEEEPLPAYITLIQYQINFDYPEDIPIAEPWNFTIPHETLPQMSDVDVIYCLRVSASDNTDDSGQKDYYLRRQRSQVVGA
jgi:hypothetical protein